MLNDTRIVRIYYINDKPLYLTVADGLTDKVFIIFTD